MLFHGEVGSKATMFSTVKSNSEAIMFSSSYVSEKIINFVPI
jgi:hypothetical protein